MSSPSARPGVLIALFGGVLISLATVLYVFAFQPQLFPDRIPNGTFAVTVSAYGGSADAARAAVAKPSGEVSTFFYLNGYRKHAVRVSPVRVELPPHDSAEGKSWIAEQTLTVAAPSYAGQARLSNRLDAYAGKRSDIRWDYPDVPFASLAIAIGVTALILLSLSVAALERRDADVSASPRGLHPVMLFVQGLNAGCLLLCCILAAHLLSFMTARVLMIVLLIGLISLAAWLYKTRVWWQQTTLLRGVYAGYIGVVLLIIVSGVLAARVSPT